MERARTEWLRDLGINQHHLKIEDNIMFVVARLDIQYKKSAYLEDYIKSLPQGIETNVGERGFQLSGGQRQRIGIARSLYKGGEVLVLDEATNSLDMETEKNIVKTINSLDSEITLLIIAHNLSTIKGCSRLIIMDKGKIIEDGNYDEVIKTQEFKKISGRLIKEYD